MYQGQTVCIVSLFIVGGVLSQRLSSYLWFVGINQKLPFLPPPPPHLPHSQQMLIFLPYPGIPSLPKRIEIKISSSVSFDLMLVLLKITPNTQEPCRLRNLVGLYCFHQRKWLPLFSFTFTFFFFTFSHSLYFFQQRKWLPLFSFTFTFSFFTFFHFIVSTRGNGGHFSLSLFSYSLFSLFTFTLLFPLEEMVLTFLFYFHFLLSLFTLLFPQEEIVATFLFHFHFFLLPFFHVLFSLYCFQHRKWLPLFSFTFFFFTFHFFHVLLYCFHQRKWFPLFIFFFGSKFVARHLNLTACAASLS